ncbi:hypothetical protein SeGA_1236 [Salmonella enterica subsp. enterica serovar Gaminara str. A4-567]|nr:hypothetical protein SeGA_1236 [Salmonella enterica subsp. enterica serovar Gaminara str. A4-567]
MAWVPVGKKSAASGCRWVKKAPLKAPLLYRKGRRRSAEGR